MKIELIIKMSRITLAKFTLALPILFSQQQFYQVAWTDGEQQKNHHLFKVRWLKKSGFFPILTENLIIIPSILK